MRGAGVIVARNFSPVPTSCHSPPPPLPNVHHESNTKCYRTRQRSLNSGSKTEHPRPLSIETQFFAKERDRKQAPPCHQKARLKNGVTRWMLPMYRRHCVTGLQCNTYPTWMVTIINPRPPITILITLISYVRCSSISSFLLVLPFFFLLAWNEVFIRCAAHRRLRAEKL